MKVQSMVIVVVGLWSLGLSGAQQKLLNQGQGQIQNNSLDSTSSNGSLPSIGFPDPFAFDESVLGSARIGTAFRGQDSEMGEQLVRNPDSASASFEAQQLRTLGKEHTHDQSSSDNCLQRTLLNQENHEPRTESEMHRMYVKPGDEPWSAGLFCKRSRHVAVYTTLLILGLVHGAVNKNLSGGAWNEHFWKAPWREWEIGAGANVLELFAAVLCYYCFQIKADLSQKQQDWVARPLTMVLLGGGQMLGESMPTPDSNGWRNVAVNMWVVPTGLWYLMLGIRSIRDYYAHKSLLNPSDRGLYEAV